MTCISQRSIAAGFLCAAVSVSALANSIPVYRDRGGQIAVWLVPSEFGAFSGPEQVWITDDVLEHLLPPRVQVRASIVAPTAIALALAIAATLLLRTSRASIIPTAGGLAIVAVVPMLAYAALIREVTVAPPMLPTTIAEGQIHTDIGPPPAAGAVKAMVRRVPASSNNRRTILVPAGVLRAKAPTGQSSPSGE